MLIAIAGIWVAVFEGLYLLRNYLSRKRAVRARVRRWRRRTLNG